MLNRNIVTCGNCHNSWDESLDPCPSALCPVCNGRGYSTHPIPRIYDNGGESFDRYTVIINNDVYGMSNNARAPNGFNQYCYTINLEKHTDFFGDGDDETLMELEWLPDDVQTAIKQRVDSYSSHC